MICDTCGDAEELEVCYHRRPISRVPGGQGGQSGMTAMLPDTFHMLDKSFLDGMTGRELCTPCFEDVCRRLGELLARQVIA